VLADEAMILPGALPSPRAHTSAVVVGGRAYVFGGSDNVSMNQIVRFDPRDGSVVVMNATLPGLSDSAAVTDGRYVYLFGGHTPAGYQRQVLKYDTVTDLLTTMASEAPIFWGASAVWDGTYAHIFGGAMEHPNGTPLFRYDPMRDRFSRMNALFPSESAFGSSAAWDGHYAYIFGGGAPGEAHKSSAIYRYEPENDTLEEMRGVLPPRFGAWMTSAVWDGANFFVFGGRNGVSTNAYIAKYDPSTDIAGGMAESLPSARAGTSAVWLDGRAYVFGGEGDGGELAEIVAYSLAPAAPTDVSARSTFRGIYLQWEAPAPPTYSSLTGYRIYRGSSPGNATLLAEIGLATDYADYTCPVLTVCFYQVSALNQGRDEGPRSAEVSAFSYPYTFGLLW
jgi:N-acetylneuraminic acid mutarotase